MSGEADSTARCPVCADTGLMRWQQPVPGPDGRWDLREATHPCTCAAARAAGLWRHPAAERHHVVDAPATEVDAPRGQVRAAGQLDPGLAAILRSADPCL
ncbi:hypothetical protein ACTG9Q_05490 [Actinokineospora sp. 24-640]